MVEDKQELHDKTLGGDPAPPPSTNGGGGGEEGQKEPGSSSAPTAPSPLESPSVTTTTVVGVAHPTTDLQKKVHRAGRFGVPLRLSEEEKRNSRAERFGMAHSPQGESEEQKRKARAERFGTAGNSTTDEEAKKKARLARFATDSNLDNVEEEKRKARAIRFAESTSTAPSHTAGKSDSVRAAHVDKANEGLRWKVAAFCIVLKASLKPDLNFAIYVA